MILRRWYYQDSGISFLFPKDLVFICVGTDRVIGDFLGVLVAQDLRKAGVPNVYECNSLNMKEVVEKATKCHPDSLVVALNSALGNSSSLVGLITLRDEKLCSGLGVGKNLPSFGDYSLTGVVNAGKGIYPLKTACPNLVFAMKKNMVNFILNSIKEKAFCENCRKDTLYAVKEIESTGYFRKRNFIYKEKGALCNSCGHPMYIPSINDGNLKAFYTGYFKKYPEEEFKDMTKEELMGELGWYKKLRKELEQEYEQV